MRPIHLASLDKTRPVLVLTRELVRPHLSRVTVAPITSRVRGLSTEVTVGPDNGLDHPSVVNCDNVVTVPASALGRQMGRLLPEAGGGTHRGDSRRLRPGRPTSTSLNSCPRTAPPDAPPALDRLAGLSPRDVAV